jgi:carboxyl-terminal processing protease
MRRPQTSGAIARRSSFSLTICDAHVEDRLVRHSDIIYKSTVIMIHGAVIAPSRPTSTLLWRNTGHPRGSWDVSGRKGETHRCPYTNSYRVHVYNVPGICRYHARLRAIHDEARDSPVTQPTTKADGLFTERLAEEWKKRIAIGITISSLVLSPAALMLGGVVPALILAPETAHAVTNEQLLYLEAWRAVDRAYVDKTFNGQSWFKVREDTLKKKKLTTREDTYAEIKSMLASLNDPFTRFLEPEQYKALRGTTSGGDVTGVGLEVSFSPGALAAKEGKKNPLLVVSPAPGGPAARAGIKAGDAILQINGQDTQEMSLYAAGNALQGPEGSKVILKVASRGNPFFDQSREVTLVREKISIKNVDHLTCKANIAGEKKTVGYIRIANFSKKTAEKVREALEGFRGAVDYYVLDVRNNGGGVFNAGIQVARMLIDSGDLVLIADSDGVRDVYEAEGEAIDTKTPMVVLVNKGTASASEVLAGALKDNGRARIVGENTFGKGLIQTLVALSDESAITVTVSKYQTPNGIDINKKGIDPNVRLTEEELESIPLGSGQFCAYIQDSALDEKIFS